LALAFGVSVQAAELPTEDPPQGELHPMLAPVIEAGPYEAQWESLVTHPIPAWFQQDRIGLSAHWGPSAVPGWTPRKDTPYGVAYAEWYMNWLRTGNEAVNRYHRVIYGGVPYDDFFDGTRNLATGQVDGFFAKDFDADRWMRLFKDAGVRYFFITAKHHDGFCLWDTKYTDRNAVKMGPRRDVLREITDAGRKHGIRVGFYYSFYEWFNPLYTGEGDLADYKGAKPLEDVDGDGELEYVDDFMIPQIKELIDAYQPAYLSFDGEWDHGYPYWRSRQIVAYFYNQAAARGQEVLVNDRFGQAKEGVSDTRGVYGDIYHNEYNVDVDRTKPWAMWRGFGNSYGYNRNEHHSNILSIRETLRMMVDVVSDNGNLEFNLGPRSDGMIPEFEMVRLAAMGAWLKINGEAIYGVEQSPVGLLPKGRLTHAPASRTLYYHVYEWPEDGMIDLAGVRLEVRSARLLASGEAVAVSKPRPDTISLRVPVEAPDPHVSVIAIEYKGTLETAKPRR
jgi:alpha-L-fucosidase